MAGLKPLEAQHPTTAPSKVLRGRAAHGAEPGDDDVERWSHASLRRPVVLADRRENVDHLAGRNRPAAMCHAARNERSHTRLENGRLRADRELETAFDDVRELLMWMLVHRD